MSNNHMNAKIFIIGATIGTLLGTASALLLAPKSGKKIRKDLSDFYEDVTDKTQDIAEKVAKRSKYFMDNVQSQTCDWTDKAKCLMSDMSDCIKWFKREEEMENHTKEFVIGAVAGGVLGALAGLLLAPKSGDKFRDDIMDSYNEFSDRTQNIANSVQKKGKYYAKNARKQTNKWLDFARSFVDEFVDRAEEVNDNVTEKVKDFTEVGQERLNDVLKWASLGLRVWKNLRK